MTVDGSTGELVLTACYGFTYFDSVTLTPAGGAGGPFTFEFESGTVFDADDTDGDPGAEVRDGDDNVNGDISGGQLVALQKGGVTLDISSVPAGTYRVTLRYASPFAGNADGDRFEYLTVDGTRYGSGAECADADGPSVRFPMTADLTDLVVSTAGSEMVAVDGSTGELSVVNCYGYIFLDSVTFETIGGTSQEEGLRDLGIEIGAAVPNPFSSVTRVPFTLVRAAYVQMDVYDVLGRRVTELASGPMEAGTHDALFNGVGLAGGVYIVRLSVDGVTVAARVTLQR